MRGNRHELPLPFREEHVTFPDNRKQIICRAEALRRQLKKNPEKYASYKKTMDWLLSNYAQKANTSMDVPGRVWRIPHHGVLEPRKNKLRVVFDLTAKCEGVALNDQLLQGPDMANSLVGVLARFRKEDVALMADIEAMFYRVLIPKSQRSFCRFFWWKDGDLDGKLEEYEMCAHVCGAVSSGAYTHYA